MTAAQAATGLEFRSADIGILNKVTDSFFINKDFK